MNKNKSIYKTIGHNLYNIRKSKGLKQYAFAEEIKDFLHDKYNIKKNIQEQVKEVRGKAIDGVKKVKILDEFKTFIARGNVLDLAVGVIIGAAFQSIVTSLTNNIISPILGCFSVGDFSDYTLTIGKLELHYGAFLTDVINFIIMAFIVFLIVKVMNRLFTRKEKEVEAPKEEVIPQDIKLLEEIRDLLKEK